MNLTGEHLIAGQPSRRGEQGFSARNPATGDEIAPAYAEATSDEIDAAADAARSAAAVYRHADYDVRATFLSTVAEQLEAIGEDITSRATAETGLPEARIVMERGRTVGQLKMFERLLREGSWVRAHIDHGDPDRTPVPKPDVRRMQVPIGPVAVFGASNFPLAFSVAGGDTASALAAGCPVVVKGHPAHPGTSELVGRAILRAADVHDLPPGVFSLVHGATPDVGERLVTHPAICAVGFTGSLRGGKALFDAAARRPRPIPVFAEMGSVNPVFLLPSALRDRSDAISEAYAGSLTLGVGQFCTNPGLLLGVAGDPFESLLQGTAARLRDVAPGVMLTRGIADAFGRDAATRHDHSDVETLVRAGADGCVATPGLGATSAEALLRDPTLTHEVFGPFGLAVRCHDVAEMRAVADALPGQLTATVHAEPDELEANRALLDALERLAGRILVGGMPTGVEVCASMHHGGPFPATTDPRATSVGTGAIERFTRPVAYQGFPDALLPIELQDRNRRAVQRTVDF